MEMTNLYEVLVDFSENIDKIRQKYTYSFSDHDILSDLHKINTKISEMGEAYGKAVCDALNKLFYSNNKPTTIETVYFRSLIYNILKGNITVLMSNILIETNMVIRIDVDKYCEMLVYDTTEEDEEIEINSTKNEDE